MNNINYNFKPINGQDFQFLANYYDGNYLSEFDFINNEENSFYSVKRDKLIKFGLIGNGIHLYFESDGIFNLASKSIEISYLENGKEYSLSSRRESYNDIIYFKDAEAYANPNGSMVRTSALGSSITQYNFGYKASFMDNGVSFNFKAICKIPYNQPVMLNFRLVSDRDMNGILLIKKNGKIVDEIDAPLESGIGGEIDWQVVV